nr:hypothetical protein Iba_chr05aCG9060 [Ipomoea batatas]
MAPPPRCCSSTRVGTKGTYLIGLRGEPDGHHHLDPSGTIQQLRHVASLLPDGAPLVPPMRPFDWKGADIWFKETLTDVLKWPQSMILPKIRIKYLVSGFEQLWVRITEGWISDIPLGLSGCRQKKMGQPTGSSVVALVNLENIGLLLIMFVYFGFGHYQGVAKVWDSRRPQEIGRAKGRVPFGRWCHTPRSSDNYVGELEFGILFNAQRGNGYASLKRTHLGNFFPALRHICGL